MQEREQSISREAARKQSAAEAAAMATELAELKQQVLGLSVVSSSADCSLSLYKRASVELELQSSPQRTSST